MLAILDGSAVDDGTACEIGMFHALMQSDDSKKGIVGLLTDIRGRRGESIGVNLFACRERSRTSARSSTRSRLRMQRSRGCVLGLLDGGKPGLRSRGRKQSTGPDEVTRCLGGVSMPLRPFA